MPDGPIIERLKKAFENLSPKTRKAAAYIINNSKEATFLNASSLARAAGVSEATVTRLAYSLGFSGYAEFRGALQEHAKSVLALPKYVPQNAKGFILAEVAAMEKQSVDEMLESITPQQFQRAVQTLYKAQSVSVVGAHYNAIPAAYAAYFLQAVRPAVRLFTSVDLNLFTRLQDIDGQDVVLAITTARYPQDTQKMLPLFKERGATVIAITDSPISPVLPLADQALIVPLRFLLAHIDPYAAVMILIHALITAVSNKDAQKSKARIKDYHRFMDYHDYHAIRDMKLN